jgi:hypothetical protein
LTRGVPDPVGSDRDPDEDQRHVSASQRKRALPDGSPDEVAALGLSENTPILETIRITSGTRPQFAEAERTSAECIQLV